MMESMGMGGGNIPSMDPGMMMPPPGLDPSMMQGGPNGMPDMEEMEKAMQNLDLDKLGDMMPQIKDMINMMNQVNKKE